MKCLNCNSEIPKGKMVCPICGAEVRLVPDYESLDDLVNGRFGGPDREKDEPYEEQPARPLLGKNTLRTLALGAGILLILGVVVYFYLDSRKKNDYNYQLERAEACFERGNYTDAILHARQALRIRPQAEAARLMEARILIHQKDYESALPVLKAVISLNSASLEAYEALIFIYYSDKDYDAVKELLTDADDIVRLEFDDYICDRPEFSPSEGVYYSALAVSGEAEWDSDIYYTLDGSDPLESGHILDTPIMFGEGEYNLRAIAVNRNGILSDSVSRSYTVLGADPQNIEISPVSGDYDAGTMISILARGGSARYAFDSLGASQAIPADGVLDMPEGRHTLYVFIFDENENLTALSSRTFFVS